MVCGTHSHLAHRGHDPRCLQSLGEGVHIQRAVLRLGALQRIRDHGHAENGLRLDKRWRVTGFGLVVRDEAFPIPAAGFSVEGMGDKVADGEVTRIGQVARLVEKDGAEPHLQAGGLRRFHQQQQVVGPVPRKYGVGLRGTDLGDIGRKILHLVDIVQRLVDHLVAAGFRVIDDRLFHVLAPGVILVDRIDFRAERVGLLHRADQRLGPDLGVSAEAEVMEITFFASQFQRFRADIDVDDFLARIPQVVLANVFGDLPADGGRGALDDDLHAFGGRSLELVCGAGRAALVVVLDELDRLAVPAAGGVDLLDGIAHGGTVGEAGRGLRAGQGLKHADLDRRGGGNARQHAQGQEGRCVKGSGLVHSCLHHCS